MYLTPMMDSFADEMQKIALGVNYNAVRPLASAMGGNTRRVVNQAVHHVPAGGYGQSMKDLISQASSSVSKAPAKKPSILGRLFGS